MADLTMEITQLSHADSIWTWKSNARSRRASLWIPYFEGVEKIRGSKYEIRFNGGPLQVDLKEVDTLFLYGASGDLSLGFMDDLNQAGICLLIHRRNQGSPFVWHSANTVDQCDVLTAQILARSDQRRRAYVARTLVAARFASIAKAVPIADIRYKKLREARTIDGIRLIEAEQTKAYWRVYYARLNLSELARRDPHPVNAALDACSFFMFGVTLRWTLFHRLSPAHGFLHENSGYPGLAYDLMEPYRVIFEDVVSNEWQADQSEKTLTERSLSALKQALQGDILVTAACAVAKRKSLLHGTVLALRAYLLGEMGRFVIPVEGTKQGGRPPKLSYKVPGGRPW